MREQHSEGTADEASTDLTARESVITARVGSALRTHETPPADFDARVMRTIRAQAAMTSRRSRRAEQGGSWWMRKRAVVLSPLGGFAMAAGFAGIVALGTLATVREGASTTSLAEGARVDTVHLVRFFLQQPGASRVSLVGDFNGWSRESLPLDAAGDGVAWTISIPLSAGRYAYAFVVDGQRWVVDPGGRSVSDEFGGETSVLRVTGAGDRSM